MKNFKNFASWTAVLAGLSGFAYSYFFLVTKNEMISSIFLMLSGLLVFVLTPFFYDRLKVLEPTYSKVAVSFLAVGSIGMFIHAGYDLANVISQVPAQSNMLSQIDPRGLLTFGVMGLGILKIAYIMTGSKDFDGISLLGLLSGLLLVVIYLARLTVLDPTNPLLLYPILIEGLAVGPAWFIWVGLAWRKSR